MLVTQMLKVCCCCSGTANAASRAAEDKGRADCSRAESTWGWIVVRSQKHCV